MSAPERPPEPGSEEGQQGAINLMCRACTTDINVIRAVPLSVAPPLVRDTQKCSRWLVGRPQNSPERSGAKPASS